MLDALIFDFDGLILDTETPLFDAWQATFEHFGLPPISLSAWSHSLGRADDDPELVDPLDRLLDALGGAVDADAVQAVRREHRDTALTAMPIQPGVIELLDDAARRDLPVAIASSSPSAWIDRHLEERDLHDRFPVRSCADPGTPGKPDPTVYRRAADALGVAPERCLALEDSPNGIAAAKAAMMRCIAVPTPISRGLDLTGADRVVDSLLEVDLDQWA